ncbi:MULTISPECIES: MFS transporter [unclassified Schaalia]|uniref:MFS transporter n=1 Tax=unclassified Schaalia TaxID=2691889 RepID=UPI001E364130|nr:MULTISPECIES: MFS transporter [unclassified Schaalia]MCD4549959.1 MFS transporter [Schaalia sp. lx-260]MCD4557683.1 MFS transporter [Schaalia sp. lx-100]
MSDHTVKHRKLLTRPVIEWAMWDWGSAAFNAVATTFVFTTYLTSDGKFTDGATASRYLSIGLTVAGLVIALLAPITGQRADRRGKGGVLLGWFTGLVVVCMLAMYFVYPNSPLGPINALWLGVLLLGLGNIFFEFASVNYNAMLNHIARKEDMGRISGFGWGAGYIGGIVLLLIIYVGFIAPEVGWFGVTTENDMNIRVAMLVAAAQFTIFALPVIIRSPKPRHVHVEQPDAQEGRESLIQSYRLLWKTVRNLKKVAPHTLFFLIASAVFRDGLAGTFTYGAIIAKTTFHFTASDVMIFAIASNVVAGLATIAFGALDDKFGPKKVIVTSLIAMTLSGTGIFVFYANGPIVFWILGLILCIFVGPVQSASRSLLARMIPEGREGEIFGLYATTGRAVSFLAPAMYLLALTVGEIVNPGGEYTHWGVLGIALILLAGLLLILPVKVEEAHLDHFDESERHAGKTSETTN